MAESKKIKLEKNQSILLYKDDKVIFKRDFPSGGFFVSIFDYFVGSKEEVEQKIKELGLIEFKKQ